MSFGLIILQFYEIFGFLIYIYKEVWHNPKKEDCIGGIVVKQANFVTLEADINIAREKMINYASEYGYLDQGTITLSRQLDQLINQYTRMKYNRTQ